MAIYNHSEYNVPGGVYFFTATIIAKENVFTTPKYFEIIIDSFRFFYKERGVSTIFYVIMPNHFHWGLKLPEVKDNPSDVCRDFKRHTAKEIIKNLNFEVINGNYKTLQLFEDKSVTKRRSPSELLAVFKSSTVNIKDQRHKIWQSHSDLKIIETEKFLKQKIEYTHRNPLGEKWKLVENDIDYPYSSARYYETGDDWNGIEIQVLM